MYHDHFGLNQAPFKLTPNTEFFFNGGNRGPILEALIYTVTNGEGIVKVTGEVGSGKTMLCNMLQARLPAHIETVYLAHPNVSPEEILHAIAFELQLDVDRAAPRLEVMHLLHDYLLTRHGDGKRVVVFVEESQSMPLATLEEIRLLSNLETRNDKLLQIVLFGQPELDENLRRPNIRQLRERIAHSFRLDPLSPDAIREYLMFRMRAAGYRGPDLFSASVIRCIARASNGLTRRINLIADKALLAAFSENTHTIRLKHVEAAVRDSEFSQIRPLRMKSQFAWATALVLAGAVIGVTAYALVMHGNPGGGKTAAGTQPAPAADRGIAGTGADSPDATVAIAKAMASANASDTAMQAATPASGAGNAIAGTAPVKPSPTATGNGAPRPTAPSLPRQTGAGSSLIEQRLAATEDWLASAGRDTYSIQLLGSDNEDQLKHHLNELSKFIEVNKVFLYRTVANHKASLTVLYGSFSDRRAAQDALEKLPPLLKANRPILRTVRGIRTELRQHQEAS
jgi:type II secretory pathway predicted ATPase ExeA